MNRKSCVCRSVHGTRSPETPMSLTASPRKSFSLSSATVQRALDIARPFQDADISACIGGYHVSGCISMLKEMPEDLKRPKRTASASSRAKRKAAGWTRFCRTLSQVIRSPYTIVSPTCREWKAHQSRMFPKILPSAQSLIFQALIRPVGGCPFQCSLCSIVNVHDRKSRFRTADDLRAKRPHNGLKKGKFNVSAPCQHSQSAFFQQVSSALNHAQFFFRQLKARVQHEHHAWL